MEHLKRLIGSLGHRPNNDEVTASKWMLAAGGILFDQNKPDEALLYCESSFEIRKRLLGDSDVSTFAAMDRVARIYGSHHRYEKALPLFSECLKRYTFVFGPENSLTVSAALNLAQMYQHWGKYSDALPLYTECLKQTTKLINANPYERLPDIDSLQRSIDFVKKLVSGAEGSKRRGSKTGLDVGVGALQRRGSKNGVDITEH